MYTGMYGNGGVFCRKVYESERHRNAKKILLIWVWSVGDYRSLQEVYLTGQSIQIVTDCNTFAMTIKRKDVPLHISRWVIFLQQFDYVVKHRSSGRMRHVDALSRISYLLTDESIKHRIREAQLLDSWVKAIRKILKTESNGNFNLRHDLVYKNSNFS